MSLKPPRTIHLNTMVLVNKQRLVLLVCICLCTLAIGVLANNLHNLEIEIISADQKMFSQQVHHIGSAEIPWWVELLLNNLLSLLSLLLDLLPLLFAILSVGLTVRIFRHYAMLDEQTPKETSAINETEGWQDSHQDSEKGTEWADHTENPVYQAWFLFLRELESRDGIDTETRTPSECTEAAISAGFEASAVNTLRTVFTEVRYGGYDVTADRREQVQDALSQLDLTEGETQ